MPSLSVGIMSAAQGRYSTSQLVLDIGQGARIASSAYPRPDTPSLSLRSDGTSAVTITGWAAAVQRTRAAPQLLTPGLLASSLAGGAAYAGIGGAGAPDAGAAAALDGRIAAVSLGTPSTLSARIASLARSRQLVVADLPGGREGLADLAALTDRRPADELIVVVQRVADPRRGALLWSAVAGLPGGGGRELSSASTNQKGLVTAVDIAPTILAHLGRGALPSEIRGRTITTAGSLDSPRLRSLMARLRVIGGRRLKSLGFLLLAWAALLLLCARRPAARGRAIRAGAIGVLWAPVVVLLPAALEPSAPIEYATIALCCLGLGAVTDALLPWPRAPLAPALVALAALSADALAHTQLLMRSLLGPNPLLGARFYGIGNELKSALAVLVLAALAAALYPARRRRRNAAFVLAAGAVLAVIEGSARIGAGVGGVILVSAGFAVAAIVLLPGALSRRRLLVVLLSPVAALLALAVLDLLTANGNGHFTGSVLHARSAGDLRDVIVRRYRAAWGELHNHTMPIATGLALLGAAAGLSARVRLLAPVGGDPGWLAALGGGVTAGVVGALAEDSGPVLLVVAAFALGCLLSYLWARPAPAPAPAR
jgi:hypothetical protein